MSRKTPPRTGTTLYHDATSEALNDIDNYAINRTIASPESRMPYDLFRAMEPSHRSDWTKIPETLRKVLVKLLPKATKPGGTRSAYGHEFIPASAYNLDTQDGSAVISDLSVASHTLQNIQDLLVKASKHSGAKSKADHTASTAKSGNTNSTKPLLSNMSPVHPTAIMADKPLQLLDKNGTFQGTINKSTYRMNFHKWGADASTPDTAAPPLLIYNVSKGKQSGSVPIALIDRGANGIVAGNDCKWVGGPVLPRSVSITGIDNHQMLNIPVGTVGAISMSQRGPVLCIFHEVAYTGQHQSILSSFQMEHYGLQVDDKNPPAVGGLGRIETPDGYTFPLFYKSGLAYLKMRPFTKAEWKTLPHVMMTSDQVWDPTVFDVNIDPNSASFLASHPEQLHKLPSPDYNTVGEYIKANQLQ